MKTRKLFAVVFVLLFALMAFTLAVTPVKASAPIHVSGTLSTVATRLSVDKTAGDNIFSTYRGDSTWTGGLSCPTGNGHGIQSRIAHFAGDPSSIPAPALLYINLKVESTFTSATIDGKTGGLTLRLNGISYPDGSSVGTWHIVEGTGDLANIHGEGTWGKAAGPGQTLYSGIVHFDP